MKMKLTILYLLVSGIVYAQDRMAGIIPASKTVQSTDNITDPAVLSYLLTSPYKTEKEKVRSIFDWITQNISYYRGISKYPRDRRPYVESDLPDTTALLELTERIAIKVLTDRRGYCDGYSRLFKSLCDHASIRAEIITGYARSDINRAEEKFRSNHSWNAVYIDSSWQLIDVTWASGYISSSSREFVRHYDDYYFLTPPEQFIHHHYPDDLRWTLLVNPPPLYEFRYTPYKQRSYVKYDIDDYYPSRGVIEANVGDTIHLELDLAYVFRNRSIAPDSLWDSVGLVHTPMYSYVNPEKITRGRKVSYSYAVESDQVEWLHVMFNNDAVLRYKLNVRKERK